LLFIKEEIRDITFEYKILDTGQTHQNNRNKSPGRPKARQPPNPDRDPTTAKTWSRVQPTGRRHHTASEPGAQTLS
jgi:hypothetical protein